MKFSLFVANNHSTWENIAKIARVADRGQWHAIWNYDHLLPPFAGQLPHVYTDARLFEAGPVFEAWTLLAGLVAETRRVRLGTLVNAITFRNPALLAKSAVTLDHISGGRLDLGLGAAWHESEHKAYGFELGTVKERLDRFEEGLEVIARLLSGQSSSFEGRYYRLEDAPFAPLPVQQKLPIMIGGGGEKRTLRLVARYADAYNFFANSAGTPESFNHKLRVLDQHCESIGRDPKEIRRTVGLWANIATTPAQEKKRAGAFIINPDTTGKEDIIYGSTQAVVDQLGRLLELIEVDEVIICGLQQHPDTIQQFDEEVLAKFSDRGVV